jgi:hypothetical protein
LGHELGHAFGLAHPADTKKDADAIMWTGIYGKYPDKTYLTADDKRILMQCPFFYFKDGKPVFQKGEVIVRYSYPGGVFEQHAGKDPIYWTETKTNGEGTFSFVESRRDAEHIVLSDRSRAVSIRLPVTGGPSFLSTDGEKTWRALYQIAEPSFTDH